MSKQLAVSATFSVLMMAAYVLFGADTARQPLGIEAAPAGSPLEVSAPELPRPDVLVPILR
jgi:hypothetical protein